MRAWIDGTIADVIPITDRGLLYGDGLFETMAIVAGGVPLLEYHLQRLTTGAGTLGLPLPPENLLRRELAGAAEGHDRAVLKLIVTRGSGGRGYRPLQTGSRRILTLHAWPAYPHDWWTHGIDMTICDTRLARQPALAGIKHLNRLEQVLARNEWGGADEIQEGLMLDTEGAVIEGTMTNVFARLNGRDLVTPKLDSAGVAGVMRRYLLERASREGIHVDVAPLNLNEILGAAEVFVCNSLIGVWPVKTIGDRRFGIGEMTRRAGGWAEQALAQGGTG